MSKTTKAVTFTKDEQKLLGWFAYAVWEECGADLLQAVAEEKGKDINAVTVSRAEVIEIALDAGRMEEKMRYAKRNGHLAVTDDLLARVAAADYDTLIKAVRPSFHFARYGT